MRLYPVRSWRSTVLATITAVLATTVVATPTQAAGAPPAPAAPAVGSALTPDRAPEADQPGPLRTTPGIGGAPSTRAWSPSVSGSSSAAAAGTSRSSGVRPAADVGAPGIGLQEWFPVELRQLADRLQVMVNTANGNVVVRYNDLKIGGVGFSTDLSHVYNNLSEGSGAFGRGWTMSTGKDVGLEILADKVVFHGPTAFTSTFTRNSNGTYTAGSGINAKLTKGGDGKWTLKWDKSEDSWLFHPNGVLQQMSNNNDVKIKLNYDAAKADRLTAIYDPLGRVTTMSEYDQANRVVRMTDWTGGVHGPFAYDGSGNLKEFADREGKGLGFEYDGAGNLIRITDPRGGIYRLSYDAKRRVKTISELTGGEPAVTTFDYPATGRTTEKDPRGNTSTYHFDDKGRQTKAIDQLGHEQAKEWTANSDVASTTNGLGASITYDFDGRNNPISATMPTGAKSVAGYTDAVHPAFPTSMTDPQGNELRNVYQPDGDLISTKSVELNKDLVRYEHNDNGQVTRTTDAVGRVTTYQYDDGGRMTVERPPAPRRERVISYDDRDRIIEVYDGNKNKIHYRYDKLDRLVEIQDANDNYRPLQYNNYDANGNLASRYHGTTGVQFEYNPRNQVTVARHTGGGNNYQVHYTYDLNNNLTDIEDEGGRVKYEYDQANRLTHQGGPRDDIWATFEYDDDDKRTLTRYPGEFRVKATYDDSGRQTALVASRPDGSKPINRTYRWTDGEADTSLLQSENRDGKTLNYRYDSQNHLLAQGPVTYQVDQASTVTAAEGSTFTLNPGGQVTKFDGVDYNYDNDGNLTTGTADELTNVYSITNQLTSLTSKGAGKISFTYDTVDQSQRDSITTDNRGTVTRQLITNTAIGVTGVVTDGRRSVFVRDSGGGLIGQVTEAGESLFAVTDYQGSTLLLVDSAHKEAARYDYKPYGTTTKTGRAADGNPFRWIGGWQLNDAHGTYALGHRQHDPKLARFTQPDPSRQEPNPYAYGLCNPISNTDPTGLAFTWCSTGFFAAGVVAAVGLYFAPVTAGSSLLIGIGIEAGLFIAESLIC